MAKYPKFRDEPWYDDELEDYHHAQNDDERRQMLLLFGVDQAHRHDAERLFHPAGPSSELPSPVEPPSPVERVEVELKKQTDIMSNYEAKHEEEKRSEQLQAEKDKKQSFRHDFMVAVFSAVLVYFLDHLQDIFDLINKIFRFFSR